MRAVNYARRLRGMADDWTRQVSESVLALSRVTATKHAVTLEGYESVRLLKTMSMTTSMTSTGMGGLIGGGDSMSGVVVGGGGGMAIGTDGFPVYTVGGGGIYNHNTAAVALVGTTTSSSTSSIATGTARAS